MNRRLFMKSVAALGALATIGPLLLDDKPVEITEYFIDYDIIGGCIKFDGSQVVDGQIIAEVSLDAEKARSAVFFLDSNGNRYTMDQVEAMIDENKLSLWRQRLPS